MWPSPTAASPAGGRSARFRGPRGHRRHGAARHPGFVDIHTHYDGQVTWDPYLTPSSWHGVTTVVMGNCGVGFAPVHPDKRRWLVELMEGVEDIPGTALTEGMHWGWETFPEYLDFLDAMPRALDVGAQVAHGPVRAYVMGAVAATRSQRQRTSQPWRPSSRGHRAGALGFTTSRTMMQGLDGTPVRERSPTGWLLRHRAGARRAKAGC
jgi:N-acyl-D-aspartate/D-glutamate deacylase